VAALELALKLQTVFAPDLKPPDVSQASEDEHVVILREQPSIFSGQILSGGGVVEQVNQIALDADSGPRTVPMHSDLLEVLSEAELDLITRLVHADHDLKASALVSIDQLATKLLDAHQALKRAQSTIHLDYDHNGLGLDDLIVGSLGIGGRVKTSAQQRSS